MNRNTGGTPIFAYPGGGQQYTAVPTTTYSTPNGQVYTSEGIVPTYTVNNPVYTAAPIITGGGGGGGGSGPLSNAMVMAVYGPIQPGDARVNQGGTGIVPPHRLCPPPVDPCAQTPDFPVIRNSPYDMGGSTFLTSGQRGECIPCGDSDSAYGLYTGDTELHALLPCTPTIVDFEYAMGKRAMHTAMNFYCGMLPRQQVAGVAGVNAAAPNETTRTFTSAFAPTYPSIGWLVTWHVKQNDAEGPSISITTADTTMLDGSTIGRSFTFPLVGGVDPRQPQVVRGAFVLLFGKKYTFGSDVSEFGIASTGDDAAPERSLIISSLPTIYSATAYDLVIHDSTTTRVVGALRRSGVQI